MCDEMVSEDCSPQMDLMGGQKHGPLTAVAGNSVHDSICCKTTDL